MVIKAGDTLESITLHVLESELSQGVSKCPLSYYLEASRLARHIYTDITKDPPYRVDQYTNLPSSGYLYTVTQHTLNNTFVPFSPQVGAPQRPFLTDRSAPALTLTLTPILTLTLTLTLTLALTLTLNVPLSLSLSLSLT